MEYSEFMTRIVGYYGDFENDVVKKAVGIYVVEAFQESELKNVFNKIILSYSRNYKTPPDVAIIEKIFQRAIPNEETLAEEAWKLLRQTDSGFSVIVSDLIAQETVISFGGWHNFAQRRRNDEYWTHKDFISRYSRLRQQGSEHIEPRILLSWSAAMNGEVDYRFFKILGDKTKGEEFLKIIEKQTSLPSSFNKLLDDVQADFRV